MKSPLKSNVLANVLQMLVSAVLLFFLYRFMTAALGMDKLGVWAVVMSMASVTRIADLGIGAAITRLVAVEVTAGRNSAAARIIETGLVTMAVVLSLGLFALSPLLNVILAWLVEPKYRQEALELLPYALLSLWTSMLATLVMSGMDGCQRMVARAMLATAAQVVMVVAATIMIPTHGVKGVVFGQVIQAVFLLTAGWILLARIVPSLSIIPWRWDRCSFRSLLGYSLNVQAASLMMLLFEPVTKGMLAKFGGLAMTGQFEIALQVVLKVRSLLVAANQAVVPRVAELSAQGGEHVINFYRLNLQVLIVSTFLFYSVLSLWAAPVSIAIVGHVDPQFLMIYQVVLLGWFVNSFCIPAYFANLGTGDVGMNTTIHAGMGLMNVALGVCLGTFLAGLGVLVGYTAALAISSMALVGLFHRHHSMDLSDFVSREVLLLGSWCVVLAGVGMIVASNVGELGGWAVQLGSSAVLSVMALIGAMRHPRCAYLVRQVGLSKS